MINSFKNNITHFYQDKTAIELKRAIALFYYACSGLIILPLICLIMAFVAPKEVVFGIINSGILLVFIGFTLWLIKHGKYPIAANTLTTVILISTLSTLYIRSYQNPIVYFSTFELLLLVIVQASLFCTRRWVIFYSLVTIVCNVVFYLILKNQAAPEFVNSLLTGAIYAALSIILVTIISQLSIAIFKSAIDQIEDELHKNKEYVKTIETLHNTSQKLRHQIDQVKDVSLRDELTGLRNRRYISEVIQNEIASFINQKLNTIKHGKNLRNYELGFYGVYMADLDHFKKINDTYGHDAGDKVLKQIAQLFLNITREDDVVIRWGGEEFLILLKNTKPHFLNQFADKLGQKVQSNDFHVSSSLSIKLTCSIGFTHLPLNVKKPDQITLTDAITLADQALYHSKKSGRNRWTAVQENNRVVTSNDIPTISQSLLEAEEKGFVQVIVKEIN